MTKKGLGNWADKGEEEEERQYQQAEKERKEEKAKPGSMTPAEERDLAQKTENAPAGEVLPGCAEPGKESVSVEKNKPDQPQGEV